MRDLDRHEEFAREQRQAGGPYDPEPMDPPRGWPTGAPSSPGKPWPPRSLSQPGVEVLRYWTWRPTWQNVEERMVTVEYRGETFDLALSEVRP